MVAIDARESQLNFLISAARCEPELLICSVCRFPFDLHAHDHDFNGFPVQIIIEQIKIELSE